MGKNRKKSDKSKYGRKRKILCNIIYLKCMKNCVVDDFEKLYTCMKVCVSETKFFVRF